MATAEAAATAAEGLSKSDEVDRVIDDFEDVVVALDRECVNRESVSSSAEVSGAPPTPSLELLRDKGRGSVKRRSLPLELMQAVLAVESVLEGLKTRRDLSEQIFCSVDKVDRYMRIDKLIEVSEEHVEDKNGRDQLQGLRTLLVAIQGILSKPPCGTIYNFPIRPKINFSDWHSKPVGMGYDGFLVPPDDSKDTSSSATSSHVWVPRGKSLAWAWGDTWRPAKSAPWRYSKWFDLRQAVEDLQKFQDQGVARPVFMLIWETELFANIEGLLLWLAAHQQAPLQITWMWGDLIATANTNPARWSPWMSVDNIVVHMESFQLSSPSRPVKISVSSEKLCSNVPDAINHIQKLTACGPALPPPPAQAVEKVLRRSSWVPKFLTT